MKHTYFLKSVIIGGISLFAAKANAQMDSCNIFLKGKYVEVGISPGGAYGSSVSAPAGYIANGTSGGNGYGCDSTGGSTHLGFIADPDMDGWAVGTPPFFGDYFMPGYPYEGWEIQVGASGPNGQAFNGAGYIGALSGANISYTTSGTTISGTWQGTFDSIGITQITTIDTNELYFTVKVILTNTSTSPVNNIYYLRALDPDNAVMQDTGLVPGGSSTINKIEYQLPDSLNATVVSARDSIHPQAYLALGTTDTNAKCYITNGYLESVSNLSDIYTGSGTASAYHYAPGFTEYRDEGIGLVIKIPHLATVDSAADSVSRVTAESLLHPANSASFTYFYAFSKAAADSAIKHTTVTATGNTHVGIKNVNNTPGIIVYPNPAKDVINVTGIMAGDYLSLYDMMGRVTSQNIAGSQGTYTLPMNNVSPGAYILVVQDASENMKSRVPVRKQ